MKIATLGSCQAMALNWYIHQLLPDSECKWVSPEIFHFWGNKPQYTSTKSMWQSQANHNIFNTDEGIDYIKSSDYIIYQKIKPSTSTLIKSTFSFICSSIDTILTFSPPLELIVNLSF